MAAELPDLDDNEQSRVRALNAIYPTVEVLAADRLLADGWEPVTDPAAVHDGEVVYAVIRGLRRPALVVGHHDGTLFLGYCTAATGDMVRTAQVKVRNSGIAANVHRGARTEP